MASLAIVISAFLPACVVFNVNNQLQALTYIQKISSERRGVPLFIKSAYKYLVNATFGLMICWLFLQTPRHANMFTLPQTLWTPGASKFLFAVSNVTNWFCTAQHSMLGSRVRKRALLFFWGGQGEFAKRETSSNGMEVHLFHLILNIKIKWNQISKSNQIFLTLDIYKVFFCLYI